MGGVLVVVAAGDVAVVAGVLARQRDASVLGPTGDREAVVGAAAAAVRPAGAHLAARRDDRCVATGTLGGCDDDLVHGRTTGTADVTTDVDGGSVGAVLCGITATSAAASSYARSHGYRQRGANNGTCNFGVPTHVENPFIRCEIGGVPDSCE